MNKQKREFSVFIASPGDLSPERKIFMNKSLIKLFILIGVILFLPAQIFSQIHTRQPHALQQDIVQPHALQLYHQLQMVNIRNNQKVKVLFSNGRSDSAFANQIPLNASVIGTGKSITSGDEQKQEVLKKLFRLDFHPSQIKIIPELYIKQEEGSSRKKLYSLAFIPQIPMQYNFTRQIFEGKLGFYLFEDPPDPNNTNVQFNDPVIMELASSDIESINPKELRISHLYIPSFEVGLEASLVQDSAMVMIRTISNPAGYKTFVKVRPALEIVTNRRTIQGFGIQEIPLTVRYIGTNSSEKIRINLTTEKGKLTPNELDLKFNEPAIVMLRSEGIGESMITAVSARQESNMLPVLFVFPMIFLLASILGGFFGAFAKFYGYKGEKKFSFKPLLIGAVVGLIGAVGYYVLGINLIHLNTNSTFNEFAVFGFSSFCAFFGIKKGGESK